MTRGYYPDRRTREAVVFAARDEASGSWLGCVTYVPDLA